MKNPKLITVFRFHKNFDNTRERVRILRHFDPDIPVYGLFGGDRKDFNEAKKALEDLAEDVWLFPKEKSKDWKWKHTDIMLRHWYREVGKDIDFDFVFSYEYDLLTVESLRKIYPHIDGNSLALSAVTALDEVEQTWSWTSKPELRKNFLKFCNYMDNKFGMKRQKYVCLGPGPLLPRKFIEGCSGLEDIDFVHEEISIPAYAETLGFKLIDHGMHPGFEYNPKEERFFTCRGHIKIKSEDILSELSKPEGRRSFHPVKQNISLENIKTAMIFNMKPAYRLYDYGGGYIQLHDLNPGDLPKTIEAGGEHMVIKPEFHISLVWVGRLSEMVDPDNKDRIETEMVEEFNKFTDKYSLDDYKLTKELRLVEKEGLKTVIVMASVANLDIFFKKLSEKYGTELPVQPTHITLYTLPTDKIGIGLLSDEELKQYSRPINMPKIQSLL